MQSDAKNVSDYLDEVPAERRTALGRLRELCLDAGFEESMRYGGPCYLRDGQIEVGFASQKHFIGLYFMRTDVLDAHRDLLKTKGISLGKSCVRYSKAEKIDFRLVEKMLKAARDSTGESCA